MHINLLCDWRNRATKPPTHPTQSFAYTQNGMQWKILKQIKILAWYVKGTLKTNNTKWNAIICLVWIHWLIKSNWYVNLHLNLVLSLINLFFMECRCIKLYLFYLKVERVFVTMNCSLRSDEAHQRSVLRSLRYVRKSENLTLMSCYNKNWMSTILDMVSVKSFLVINVDAKTACWQCDRDLILPCKIMIFLECNIHYNMRGCI